MSLLICLLGIIISFMKKQKPRDIDKITQTIPANFKTVPIHLVDLPDNSTEPIVDTIKVSEEWRQNQVDLSVSVHFTTVALVLIA